MKHTRVFWAVPIWMAFLSLSVSIASATDWEQDEWKRQLKYAHLVFVGTVIDVADEHATLDDVVVNRDEVVGRITGSESFLIITFKVDRIVRGNPSGRDDVVVAVLTSYAAHDLHYEVGMRTIMCVWKEPGCVDDIFFLKADPGRLVMDGEGVIHDQSNTKRAMDEINSIVSSVSLDSVAVRADVAVLADVTDVQVPGGEPGKTSSRDVTFRIEKVLKGVFDAPELRSRIDVWGKHSAESPEPKIGETWYLLLSSTGSGYELVDGSNSFFKLQNGKVIYDNMEELPTTREQFETKLREVSR